MVLSTGDGRDDRYDQSSCCPFPSWNRSEMGKIRKEYSTAFDIASASKYHQGTYMDFWDGIELCQKYGLVELEEGLLGLQPASEDAALEAHPGFVNNIHQYNIILHARLCLKSHLTT